MIAQAGLLKAIKQLPVISVGVGYFGYLNASKTFVQYKCTFTFSNHKIDCITSYKKKKKRRGGMKVLILHQ